jgi:hypothetical protein
MEWAERDVPARYTFTNPRSPLFLETTTADDETGPGSQAITVSRSNCLSNELVLLIEMPDASVSGRRKSESGPAQGKDILVR